MREEGGLRRNKKKHFSMPNPFLFISQLVSLLLSLTVRFSVQAFVDLTDRSNTVTSTFSLSSSSFLSSNLQSHKRTLELSNQAIETRRLTTRSQGLLKDQDSLVLKVFISIYNKKLRSSAREPISKTEELGKEIGGCGGRGEGWMTRLPFPSQFTSSCRLFFCNDSSIG